jgi:SecD/SecF fusion protein
VEQKNLTGRWLLIGLVVAISVWAYLQKGIKLGQDLKGGTSLRFALDIERARAQGRLEGVAGTNAEIVQHTIDVIGERINRYGVAELNLAALGEDKFEISLPSQYDTESIVKVVTALGDLQFRIEVRPQYESGRDDEEHAPRTRGEVWVGAVEDPDTKVPKYARDRAGFEEYLKAEVANWKKARDEATPYKPLDPRYRVVKRRDTPGATEADFALLEEPADPHQRFGGEILTNIKKDYHWKTGEPVVTYDVKTEFQRVFGEWTLSNAQLPMAIVLNEEWDSAPTIQNKLTDHVQITLGVDMIRPGGKARGEERAKELVTVLQTGSLKVQPRLESTSSVGPTLAGEAVRRGLTSTAIAFLLVLIYMLVYYRTAGLFANVALLLNLVLLVGSMAFLEAALTLPGIAGVVLTLGMAVDANILVYERIREEQARGRSVGRAVSEGFDRAFTTIVDSNVTTFFTAIFLYVFGTGSIKGFAVSLSLGLLASMFTAVYVTRTFFEAWVRRGKVKHVSMLGTGKPPQVRWMHMRKWFIPASIVLMFAGVLLFLVSPSKTVYDIDFTGGIKLQARFDRPTTVDEVKKALDSGVRDVRVEKDVSRGDAEKGTLAAKAGPYPGAEVVEVGREGTQVEVRVALAGEGAALTEREQVDALKGYIGAALKDRLLPAWVRQAPVPYVSTGDADPHKEFDGRLKTRIALEDPKGVLTAETLEARLRDSRPYYSASAASGGKRIRYPASKVVRKVAVEALPPEAGGSTALKTYDVWIKTEDSAGTPVETDPASMRQELKEYLASAEFRSSLPAGGDLVSPADPFPVDDLVGAGVAKRLRNDALFAILLSFVAIIAYIAFRFRSYAMGFAAVLCLVHDVCIALGAVCLVDHLGVVDARISLGLVAAFLTIVGYSVNDTVVTFDRIRELRGSAPTITTRMIEDAVNQTFSRTLRTTATVLLTVVVLFAMNLGQRSLLEGLSFTLLVGVTSGAYSTIGVASPLLLFLPWYWARARKYRPRGAVMTWPIEPKRAAILAAACVATTVAVWAAGQPVMLAVFWGLIVVPFMATIGLWVLWVAAFAVASFVISSVMLIPWSYHEDPEGAVEADRRSGALPAAEPAPREAPRSAAYRAKAEEEEDEEEESAEA